MFYHYTQNNSGGSFVIDQDLAHHVIIEAHSVEDANERAESIGLYFDGCETGVDCDCCGDRWYRQTSWDDGTEFPMIYGQTPELYRDVFAPGGGPYCHIYYLDGLKRTLRQPDFAGPMSIEK